MLLNSVGHVEKSIVNSIPKEYPIVSPESSNAIGKYLIPVPGIVSAPSSSDISGNLISPIYSTNVASPLVV